MIRALCFAAHPDDLETYLGSTLLWLARGGAELRFVICTDGEAGSRQPEDGTRRDEQQRSLDWLAGQLPRAKRPELDWLGLPDGGLAGVRDRLRDACARGLADFGPDLVFAPKKDDPHPDHAALGNAAVSASGTAAGRAARLWHWLPAEPEHVSHVLPVDPADFERKLEWIRTHASQIPGPGESRAHLPGGHDIVQRIRARDARWGRHVGTGHAEPLLLSGCQANPDGGGIPVVLRRLEDLY